MNLTQKLLKIVELVNSEDGIGFLKIRLLLEDVQIAVEADNPKAIQFEQSLDQVLRLCEVATKTPFDSGT